MNDLIFLDTETTGLDAELHDVWELAYSKNGGAIETYILPHSLKTADPKALAMNGYFQRYPLGARADGPMGDIYLKEIFAGNTLVCANPTFDRMMLWKRWGLEPWHYRSIDVESMALVVFDWDRPHGLKDIAAELRDRKHDIPEPDHTAAKDVEVLRACYYALRNENQKYKIY